MIGIDAAAAAVLGHCERSRGLQLVHGGNNTAVLPILEEPAARTGMNERATTPMHHIFLLERTIARQMFLYIVPTSAATKH